LSIYNSQIFFFILRTAQEDSQNKMRSPTYIMTQIRLLKMIFSLPKKERDFVKFVCPMKHTRTKNKTKMKA